MAGEGNDAHPVGVSLSVGAGAGIEGHVGMSNTQGSQSYNIYEIVDYAIQQLNEQEKRYR